MGDKPRPIGPWKRYKSRYGGFFVWACSCPDSFWVYDPDVTDARRELEAPVYFVWFPKDEVAMIENTKFNYSYSEVPDDAE